MCIFSLLLTLFLSIFIAVLTRENIQKKTSWRKLIKSSLEQKSGGGNLPWRLGVDLAGAARSHRWELSSRTCLTVLRKSKQPDKCLAAHPRTTLRNVLPTSAPASVAVAGDRQTEPVPGSRQIPLGAPSCTQDKRREGSPRWKPISKIPLKNGNDDWKCPRCPSSAHGVAGQEVTLSRNLFQSLWPLGEEQRLSFQADIAIGDKSELQVSETWQPSEWTRDKS